jgi:hypothetical protein
MQGGVLILTAIRSMLWYHTRSIAHYVTYGTQLGAGVILMLLGLLDIGSKSIAYANTEDQLAGTNPMYQLLDEVSALTTCVHLDPGLLCPPLSSSFGCTSYPPDGNAAVVVALARTRPHGMSWV